MVVKLDSHWLELWTLKVKQQKVPIYKIDIFTLFLVDTWDMLGTNLSVKLPDGGWTTDTSRLILMDRKDFNQLGLGIDDLIDAYIQTVLSVIAIDRMSVRLMENGTFDYQLFQSLNPDDALLNEIKEANGDF